MERPRSILVISRGSTFRKGFFVWERKKNTASPRTFPQRSEVVRIALPKPVEKQKPLDAILGLHDALQGGKIYDLILIADIFEMWPTEEILKALEFLTTKVKKQVLAVIPQKSENISWGRRVGVQKYHPVLFSDFNFSYLLLGRKHENKTQLYSFFKSSKKREQNKNILQEDCPARPESALLRLAYVLPDHDLTGGMKQLLLQAQAMHKRGHHVSLYTKSSTASNAIPRWSDLAEEDIDGQYVLKPTEDFQACIGSVDAIILGWMEQVPEFQDAQVPVFLWEQGSRLLFGDFSTPQSSTSKERAEFHSFYKPPLHIMAVSPLVQKIVNVRFGRQADLVCAAIKENTSLQTKQQSTIKQILLVGDGEKDFKNFGFAIQALVLAAQQGAEFTVHWATPTPAIRDMVPKSLRVEYHVMPSQEDMDSLYRASDLLLSHSLYEAFSLPPLEAMAAGTAVLAINNGGIETYAVSGKNCLLCKQGDLAGYVKGMHTLLKDDLLRQRLQKAGLVTAKQFSADAMCDNLENSLYRILEKTKSI